MSERLYALLLFAVVFCSSAVYAETPAQGVNPGPASAPSPSVDQAPAARIRVDVKGDLLSVDLAEAEFGSVMNAIAAKAGIKVDMSGGILNRKLTTRFSGIELGRGISRLMTLLQEKNYTIRYDTKGQVSAVEVYSNGSTVSPAPKTPPRPGTQPAARPPASGSEQPLSGVQKNPPQQRRLIPLMQPAPAAPSQNGRKDDPGDAGADEDADEDLPYIPPQKKAPSAPR